MRVAWAALTAGLCLLAERPVLLAAEIEAEALELSPLLIINPAIKYTKSCCVGDTWMPEIRTDSLRA